MADLVNLAALAGEQAPLPSAVTLQDLVAMKLQPRRWIVEGLLMERDSMMAHAWRGIGKSRFLHGLCLAIAAGGPFLRYRVEKPRGVLLVDGELPREPLQSMLLEQLAGAAEPVAPLKVLARDLIDGPLPSLATREGQEIVEANLDGCEVLAIDSLTTLADGAGDENSAESWDAMQRWLLDLRKAGLSVVLLHHDGKNRQQRGTSRREDVLSQVVHLTRPDDYSPAEGARFVVTLTKARHVVGEAALPFEAALAVDQDGRASWTWRPVREARAARARELAAGGLSQRDIARELGVSIGTINADLRGGR